MAKSWVPSNENAPGKPSAPGQIAPAAKVYDLTLKGKEREAALRKKPIDVEQVLQCARLGLTMEEAAGCIGVSRSTLSRQMSKSPELAEAWIAGQALIRRELRHAQLVTAIKDRNPTMLIWMGKQYLGQRDKDVRPPSITIEDSDKTVTVTWDDELEAEFHDVMAMDAEYEVVSADDTEAAPAIGAESEADAASDS